MEIKYKGVKKRRRNGKVMYEGAFIFKRVHHYFGIYKDAKECAKAHDFYVLRNNIDRKTNFIKKKVAQ